MKMDDEKKQQCGLCYDFGFCNCEKCDIYEGENDDEKNCTIL